MYPFSATPSAMLSNLWHNRELISAFVNREILGRYRGSVLGLFWSYVTPLLMLSVYTFVFSVVLNARWGNNSDSRTEFVLILFAGLIVFNLFAECINRAPTLILSNPNYVKKVVFPLEVIPFVNLLSASYHALISVGIWLITYMLLFGWPHKTVIYFPLIILPFCLFVLGCSWALASLGVFLRDISQIIGVLTTTLMFLSPIFYPATALPQAYQNLLYLNPLTIVVEQIRDVLFWGKSPNFSILGVYWLISMLIAWLGFAWFQKTRKGFADVL